jgi:hypothetical protein
MLRNLRISKWRPRRPTRGWRKKTGPRVSSLIAIAIASSSGESTTTASPAAIVSNARLISCEERLSSKRRIPSSATPGS